MLDGILALWFILTGLSLLFVIWDCITNTPVSWVQKLAWILVTLYSGPFGLFLYLLACRNPGPGLHDQFTAAHWKQAVNSEMHCLAGDATGIIIAAFVVFALGLADGVDLVIEYLTAFLFGLLIFQALMMRSMYDGDYVKAIRKTFFAETVSMNCVMIGMIPMMVVLMHHLPDGDNPWRPVFWFVMGMATITGGLTAYPINSWLVRNKLKHGCMTLPEKGAEAMPMEHTHHEMGKLPTPKAVALIVVTFALLLIAAWLTSTFLAPIRFSA